MEQNDEWAEGRRYLSLDVLTRARLRPPGQPSPDTTAQPELEAA